MLLDKSINRKQQKCVTKYQLNIICYWNFGNACKDQFPSTILQFRLRNYSQTKYKKNRVLRSVHNVSLKVISFSNIHFDVTNVT